MTNDQMTATSEAGHTEWILDRWQWSSVEETFNSASQWMATNSLEGTRRQWMLDLWWMVISNMV